MIIDAMVGVVRLGDGWDEDDTLPPSIYGIRCSGWVLHNVFKVSKHESKVWSLKLCLDKML